MVDNVIKPTEASDSHGPTAAEKCWRRAPLRRVTGLSLYVARLCGADPEVLAVLCAGRRRRLAGQMVRGRRQVVERHARHQGRTRLRAQQRLHGRHQAADRFRLRRGPDIFIISPGDFLRYYNGGVLLDLTPFMEQAGAATISSRASSPAARLTARFTRCPRKSSRWRCTTASTRSRKRADRERRPQDLGPIAERRQETDQRRSATACCSKPSPAIIRTSPGIPSSGRAAANSDQGRQERVQFSRRRCRR